MKTRSGFAQGDGSSLYYELCGNGPPVVLIHGFSLDLTMWDDQVSDLSSSHTVLRYDLRGHGRSVGGNTRYHHAGDLTSLLDHLGLERVALVGLSLGGSTALNFTLAHPGRVNALVMIDPSLSGFAWSNDTAEAQRKLTEMATSHGVEALRSRWLSMPLFRTAMKNPRSADKLRAIVGRYPGWHWLNPDFGIPTNPPTIERLHEIAVSTLIMVGEQDARDFHDIAAILESRIPNARRVVINGAGHMVNLEQPEEFNRVLKNFLSEIFPSTAAEQ